MKLITDNEVQLHDRTNVEEDKVFIIEITELLKRQIRVVGNSEMDSVMDARDAVEELYANEEIVLDADDYCGAELNVVGVEDLKRENNNRGNLR